MVMEYKFLQMETNTGDTIFMVSLMVLESIIGKMGQNIKVILRKVSEKEKVRGLIKTWISMRVTLVRIEKMGLVSITGQMGIFIKVNFVRI